MRGSFRGIEEKAMAPQIHLGAKVCAVEKKGFKTDKGNHNRRIRQHNLQIEISDLERQMETIRSEHRKSMVDYIEANIGCKVSDAFVIHDEKLALEEYEKFLQSQNVPCEFMIYSNGKYELFIPKADKDRAFALLAQLKNNNQNMDNHQNTQQKKPAPKKSKPRL